MLVLRLSTLKTQSLWFDIASLLSDLPDLSLELGNPLLSIRVLLPCLAYL